jgi:hypothetical protein
MYFNGSIGRITDYIKTVQLEQKWQQKKIEISTAKPKDGKSISAFLNPNEDWLKSKRLGDITNKMKSGKRLSHDEKEFLRIHAPDLYEKAMKIEKERDEFRRALANCKTKEEVARLKAAKSIELQAEAQAMSGKTKETKDQGYSEFIAMRMMAISDEFADFVKSEEYAGIPNEYEENEEEGEGVGKSEGTEKNKKVGKVKFKKAKLTLNEEMAYNGYKINEAKILNKTKFSEPAKPVKQSGYSNGENYSSH